MIINTLKIKRITKLEKKAHVYDLSVDETHNFFVGKSQVLTSNCDGLTMEGMRALRNVMEEYSHNTRFILTANYKHKIIPPIQSRCQTISFEHNLADVAKHCAKILSKEEVVIPKEQFVSFQSLIKANFPDFRKILNELQKYSLSGTLKIKNSSVPDEFVGEIFNKIKNEDSVDFREYVIKHENVFQSDYHSLLKALLNFIYEQNVDSMKKKESIMVLGHHMDRHSSVMDVEINAFVAMINLSKIFHT
jgi:DNA polymerase III delta prime subunit